MGGGAGWGWGDRDPEVWGCNRQGVVFGWGCVVVLAPHAFIFAPGPIALVTWGSVEELLEKCWRMR